MKCVEPHLENTVGTVFANIIKVLTKKQDEAVTLFQTTVAGWVSTGVEFGACQSPSSNCHLN